MSSHIRLRVGYVALHMTTYFAERHGVFSRAQAGLEALASREDLEIISAPRPITTFDEAAAAREYLKGFDLDVLIMQFATCTISDPVLELAELGCPLVLWAVPEPRLEGPIQLNSFVAMQIAASALHRRQRARPTRSSPPAKWIYGEIDSPDLVARLGVTLRALRARRALTEATIGMVGNVAPGFANLTFDPGEIADKFGSRFAYHDVSLLLNTDHSHEEVTSVVREMVAAAKTVNVSDEDLQRSAVAYLNLRRLVTDYGYTALAVRDWPELQELGKFSPLLAMAWLQEHDEIPVACEGDGLGALTLLALEAISHSMPTLLDLGPADPTSTRLLVWHLGSSPHRFADSSGVSYECHSTLGRGAEGPFATVVDQIFASGAVTLATLSDGGQELLVGGGRLTSGPTLGPSGDRGWLADPEIKALPTTIPELLNTALVRGLSHHCGLVRGRWQDELIELAAWLGLEVMTPVECSRSLQLG